MNLMKKHYIKQVVNFFLNILIFMFGIILLISVYTGVQTKILGNKYTNFFGYSIFEVQTGSMSGSIDAGDWIIVKLTKDVKLNDVITYESKGEYITHRVIEVYKGTYVTKGDANNAKDDPIDQSQIVGRVSNVLANFGILRKTIFNPAVLLTLIVTLLLFNFAFKKEESTTEKEDKVIFKNKSIEKIRVCMFEFLSKVMKTLYKYIQKLINFCKDKYLKIKDMLKKSHEDEVNAQGGKNTDVTLEVLDGNSNNVNVSEDSNYNDDEFSKTSLYRVISVDSLDVDDKFKPVPQSVDEEDEKEETTAEEDLDKTSLYSVIPVDLSEINDTFLEIAENEVISKPDSEVVPINKKEVEDTVVNEEETVDDDNLTKINLDLLKSKREGKGKNVIDSVIYIKKEEINELISLFLDESKIYTSKATIKSHFMDSYIEAKYYNSYINSEKYMDKKNMLKSERVLLDIRSKLSNDDNNSKYSSAVDVYSSAFTLIDLLEKARDSISDLKAKREYYKKVILKEFSDLENSNIEHTVEEVINIQKKYKNMIQYFLKSFDTNTFVLNVDKLDEKKDIYIARLGHNINFSKIYSDYIIDKTYSDGIVAEDKLMILFTLLSVQIVKDMFDSLFNKKYLLCVPSSLYEKEKKMEKVFKLIDDDYAKGSAVVLISPNDLFNNGRVVRNIKKLGYKFALAFNSDIELKEKDRSSIYLMDYIFINKKTVDSKKILPFIPDDLTDKVMYENFDEDIEGFWGDKL